MAKKKFKFEFTVTGEIEIEKDILDEVLMPDWQKDFYRFSSEQDVANHLAYNFVCHRARLTSLDGFAHKKESDAVVVKEDWNAEDVK